MPLQLRKLFKHKKKIDPSCSVIVAAAGSSSRMEGQNKLFVDIGGKPVLAHTLSALNKCQEIVEIIVVTREADMKTIAEMCTAYSISKVSKIIVGGKTRLESVYNGVQQVSPRVNLVAIHDGARPFFTERMMNETVRTALETNAAAPAVPVIGTLKQAKDSIIEKTIDRNNLYEVQTPQIFATELIKAALQNAIDKSLYITDDCMAVEAIGCPVRLTKGSRENIKLTTTDDIALAEAISHMLGENK